MAANKLSPRKSKWRRLKWNFRCQVREKIAKNNGRVGASESAPQMITLAKSLSFCFLFEKKTPYFYVCSPPPPSSSSPRSPVSHSLRCDGISRFPTKQLKTSCRCALHVSCGSVFPSVAFAAADKCYFSSVFFLPPSINRHHTMYFDCGLMRCSLLNRVRIACVRRSDTRKGKRTEIDAMR